MNGVRSRGKKFMGEFKTFTLRGNVIDLAVGVIIGGAFGKITTSLVNDVIMPLVGVIFGGVDLAQLNIILAVSDSGEPLTLGIGSFLMIVVDFLLIAFIVFLLVKFINRLRSNQLPEEKPASPSEADLLAEIRDLLKNKND